MATSPWRRAGGAAEGLGVVTSNDAVKAERGSADRMPVGRVPLSVKVTEPVGTQLEGPIGTSSVITVVWRTVEYESSVGHAVVVADSRDAGILALEEGVGNPVDPVFIVVIPVVRVEVWFPVIGATAVDANEAVTFAEGVGRADDGAVTPVKNKLVTFADITVAAVDPVPTGKLEFAEAVGTLEDGAVTPVRKKLVEFADSVGIAADSEGP